MRGKTGLFIGPFWKSNHRGPPAQQTKVHVGPSSQPHMRRPTHVLVTHLKHTPFRVLQPAWETRWCRVIPCLNSHRAADFFLGNVLARENTMQRGMRLPRVPRRITNPASRGTHVRVIRPPIPHRSGANQRPPRPPPSPPPESLPHVSRRIGPEGVLLRPSACTEVLTVGV